MDPKCWSLDLESLGSGQMDPKCWSLDLESLGSGQMDPKCWSLDLESLGSGQMDPLNSTGLISCNYLSWSVVCPS